LPTNLLLLLHEFNNKVSPTHDQDLFFGLFVFFLFNFVL
jgi:hypothetical protein